MLGNFQSALRARIRPHQRVVMSRVHVRNFAKILRWEPDTKWARQMESINDCDEFCNFCLEHENEFTKRDWIASLTYLTTRRGVNIKS